VGKREGKRPLRRTRRRCGDNITNGSSRKQWGGAWTGLTSLRIQQVADFSEHGNEHSVSIKCEEFIE